MSGTEPSLRVSVVIASKGRPAELADTVSVMARQTCRPHRLIFSVTGPEDLPDLDLAASGVEVLTGPAGSCHQRNTALETCLEDSDVIAFFDDDYVPEVRALEFIARAFAEHENLAGINGELIADGIHGEGFTLAEAMERLESVEEDGSSVRRLGKSVGALHGCHMVFRASAIGAIRFDERLPAYGWQEDIDFSAQVRLAGGRLHFSTIFAGVHRGTRAGRSPGRRLGYSQVANPVYLARKGTMPWGYARRLVLRNVIANHARMFWPEGGVDRTGRARGNWIGLVDWVRGQLAPQNIQRLS